jgi:germacradienol/geosmin synthase
VLFRSRDEGVAIVKDLITARLHQFQRVIDQELPALCAEHRLDQTDRQMLDERVVELQDWIAAILNWHVETGRYEESLLADRYQPTPAVGRDAPAHRGLADIGPSGLGISAAKLSDLVSRLRRSAVDRDA